MPILTLDLPETAYRAALAFAPAERIRLAAVAFTTAKDTLLEEDGIQPELSEEGFASIEQGLAELSRGETVAGADVFARLRTKHGFPKGNNTI